MASTGKRWGQNGSRWAPRRLPQCYLKEMITTQVRQQKLEMGRRKPIQELFRKWTGHDLLMDWIREKGVQGRQQWNSKWQVLWGGLRSSYLEILTFAATTPMVTQSKVLPRVHLL